MNEPKNALTMPLVERGKEVALPTIMLGHEYTREECMLILNERVFPELVRRGYHTVEGVKDIFSATLVDISKASDAKRFVFFEKMTLNATTKMLWLQIIGQSGGTIGVSICLDLPYTVKA